MKACSSRKLQVFLLYRIVSVANRGFYKLPKISQKVSHNFYKSCLKQL